ncbi:hypothetical protein BC941DRAFT_438499 [Chlamydoabsidia padenii]|nr:hypothetical protein BC941DRAFT_438499 [Chlamydoabsidia padenii]
MLQMVVLQSDPSLKPNNLSTDFTQQQQQHAEDGEDEDDSRPSENPASSHSLSSRLVAIGLMIIAGCCVALQAGINATLNAYGGQAFASLISFLVGLGSCLCFFALDLSILHTPPPQRLSAAPWYAWAGGILGAYYVTINVLTVPKLGAATVLSIFVCSQVITACVMDHFGLVGVPKRRYTIWRILASLGLIGCVAVITIF